MNVTPHVLIAICWLVLIVYWLISSFSAKRYAKRNDTTWAFRFVFVVIFISLFNSPWTRQYVIGTGGLFAPLWLQWLGVVLCVCGVAFAIWARYYLGRNWGMPMSLKQDAELVTTGPYRYVRHPIYSGFMLAALGSTLVTVWWLIALVWFSVYFTFAARKEEKIMRGEFGAAYDGYMKRSKMLIPFVL